MNNNLIEPWRQSLIAIIENTIAYFIIFVYWEALLFYQIHSSLSNFSVWNVVLMLPVAVFAASLCGWFAKHWKLNILTEMLVLFAVSFFYLADLIYFKSFGSLVSVSMIGAGTDAITNFWLNINTTLAENIGVIFLFELPLAFRLLFLLRKGSPNYVMLHHPAVFAAAFLLWSFTAALLPVTGTEEYTAYGAYHSRYVDTDTASVKLGALPNFIVEAKSAVFGMESDVSFLPASSAAPEETEVPEIEEVILYNGYEDLDFAELGKKTNDKTTKALCEYLNTVPPTKQNEYTGLFAGYNLIYICAESFSSMAIDENVTPTLYKMANNGIVLNNFYNSFRNTTTNGEYAALTGLWPDVARQNTNKGAVSGTMGQSIGKNMSVALGNMFELSEELDGRAYHNFLGYYYGRDETLPNMGFKCKFMNDGMTFTTTWPSSDYEMLEQSVPDYINEDRFLAYYMTFSGHGNYTFDNLIVAKNYKTVSSAADDDLSANALGYLSANYELEKAMTYLLEELEKAGKLDNTVIVLGGDHYPYYLTDESYEELRGEPMDEDFGAYKSTCIIYNAGLSSPIQVDTPCCNVDILPTIYNLFNVKYDSRLYAGTDIFGDGMHIAQLYNKSFVTDYVKYDYATGDTEWLVNKDAYGEDFLNNHLNNALATVKNRYAASIEIEESDFFRFLFNHYTYKNAKQVLEEAEKLAQEDEFTGHDKAFE